LIVSDNIAVAGTYSKAFGNITIDHDVYWSIWDNTYFSVLGSVEVLSGGGLYISADKDQDKTTVRFPGVSKDLDNAGTILLSTLNSPAHGEFTVSGTSFINSGEFFMLANGSAGIPIMAMTSATWINTGFVTFYQDVKSLKAVLNLDLVKDALVNNGDICIYNHVFPQLSGINGTGCFHIQKNSTVLLNAPLHSVSTGQVFFMEDSDSQIVGSTVTALQTYMVAGFGGGNVIGSISPILSYDYDTTSGILTLYTGVMNLIPQRYNIGLGYDPAKFSRITVPFPQVSLPKNNGITYSDAAPNNTTPSICRACPSIPIAPPATSTMTTSSSVSSLTATVSEGLVAYSSLLLSMSKLSLSESDDLTTTKSNPTKIDSETASSSPTASSNSSKSSKPVESSSSGESSNTTASSNEAPINDNMGGTVNYIILAYLAILM
jgi:hypothetical protein